MLDAHGAARWGRRRDGDAVHVNQKRVQLRKSAVIAILRLEKSIARSGWSTLVVNSMAFSSLAVLLLRAFNRDPFN